MQVSSEEAKTQNVAAEQKPQPAIMTPNKIIKLMLIRIGDEKREMVEQHLTILVTKLIDLQAKNEPENVEEFLGVFSTVLVNLPHKCFLYASIVALLAQKNSELAKIIVQYTISKTLGTVLLERQESLQSRSVFRFLAFLVDLGVIGAESSLNFIKEILNQNSDLALHCVMTFLCTDGVKAKLGGQLENLLKNQFEARKAEPDSLNQLWEAYTTNSGPEAISLSDFYLSLPAAKLNELRSQFQAKSPISSLPSLGSLPNRPVPTFENPITPPTRYIPLAKQSGETTLKNLLLLQAQADLILAFQENHKTAAQNLLKMYRVEGLTQFMSVLQDCLLTFIVSWKPFADQNSFKPIIFFSQVANILCQDLLEAGTKFRADLNEKVIDLMATLDFRFVPSLVKFQVFLNSQHEKDLVNNDFLQAMEAKLKSNEDVFHRVVHYYLSYCCQIGYHKPISEKLPEEFRDFMPNIENLKPKLEFVMNKKVREDKQQASEDGDQKLEGPQAEVQEEVERIMSILSLKGDQTELLKEVLADKTKIKSEGLKLKKIFLEILFTKFGVHSLEHVSRGVQKVRITLDEMFKDQKDAQRMALDSIFNQFGMDQISAQNFCKENLFMIQFKVCNLVVRLNQLGVIDTQTAIEWCLDQLEAFDGPVPVETTQVQLILRLLEKSAFLANHLLAKFIQDYEKPNEVRIETPFERYQRENNIEPADGEPREEKKEKTPEEIQEERAAIKEKYTAEWDKAVKGHQETIQALKAKLGGKDKLSQVAWYVSQI